MHLSFALPWAVLLSYAVLCCLVLWCRMLLSFVVAVLCCCLVLSNLALSCLGCVVWCLRCVALCCRVLSCVLSCLAAR